MWCGVVWCGVTSQSQVVFCNHEMNLIIKRHRCYIHDSTTATASTSIFIMTYTEVKVKYQTNGIHQHRINPRIFSLNSLLTVQLQSLPFDCLKYFWQQNCNSIYLKAFVGQKAPTYMIYIATILGENKNTRRYGLLLILGECLTLSDQDCWGSNVTMAGNKPSVSTLQLDI